MIKLFEVPLPEGDSIELLDHDELRQEIYQEFIK